MKNKAGRLIFLILIINTIFFFSSAQEVKYPNLKTNSGYPELPQFLAYFFNLLIGGGIVLAAIVIAWGGINYISSLNRGSFTTEAKEWIKAGVLGLLLLLSCWLILFTINPALVVFQIKELPPPPQEELFLPFSPSYQSLNVKRFSEIPIGTLVETLLTRELSCYEFNEWGNPIPGITIPKPKQNVQIQGPTYLENDRIECAFSIINALNTKLKIAEKLGEKIVDFMLQYCLECTHPEGCQKNEEVKCRVGRRPLTDPCIRESKITCPQEVQKIIENGGSFRKSDEQSKKEEYFIIKLDEIAGTLRNEIAETKEVERYLQKTFKGLSEFKSDFQDQNGNLNSGLLLQYVEQLPQALQPPPLLVNNKPIWYINKENFEKLKLIDQIIYLTIKLKQLRSLIYEDLENLEKGEEDMQDCYLLKAAPDFLKIYESTIQKNQVVKVTRSFRDPFLRKVINPAKYCKGFQYYKSHCESFCNKICPGLDEESLNCYRQLSDGSKEKNKEKRLENQAKQILDCYQKRRCFIFPYQGVDFKTCVEKCREANKEFCKNYLTKEKLEKCQEEWDFDSNVFVNNQKEKEEKDEEEKEKQKKDKIGECLIKYDNLINCLKQKERPLDAIISCIKKNAPRCPYCSDQYAGYPECVKKKQQEEEKFSSSYLYQHPEVQIYTEPYALEPNAQQIYLDIYPETKKCPVNSPCPSCGERMVTPEILGLPELLNELYEIKEETPESEIIKIWKRWGKFLGWEWKTEDQGSVETIENAPIAYRVCSTECDEYLYNDDPLTFYCPKNWWQAEQIEEQIEKSRTEPYGGEKICPAGSEIPLGYTIDHAEEWTRNFLQELDDAISVLEDAIFHFQTISNLVKEKQYCNCNDQFCGCHCICNDTDGCYCPPPRDVTDQDEYPCYCKGHPCQRIINLLIGSEKGNEKTGQPADHCPTKGIDWFRKKTIEKLIKMKKTSLERGEVLKMLVYSRKAIDWCGVNYSKGSRLFSCTRVEDEIMPPLIGTSKPGYTVIKGEKIFEYCYGREVGKLKGDPYLADNWFCCHPQGVFGIIK